MAVTADVVVAGGGVIGMAIAWRAAAAGLDVVVVDPGGADAASLVAAGMLAPVSESQFGEDALLALNLAAIERFATFAAELEDATGLDVGLRREGTLVVARDPGDHDALVRLTAFHRSLGLAAEELDSRACRRLEPFLAPDVRGGCLFAGDWSVDNRRYLGALRQAAATTGARTVHGQVAEVQVDGGQVRGVRLASSEKIDCGAVVVAAGWACGAVEGLPAELGEAVRPVKGQLLRLRHPAGISPVLGRTVRATVHGREVYLVPRTDGELVVGATSEERGPDRTVTAGAVHDLLHDAMAVLPVTSELILAETCVGLRPGTIDNGPIVGPAGPGGPSGLLIATGHYRNGILLSALTADGILDGLTGQPPVPHWAPFTPQRFTPQRFTPQRFTPQRFTPQRFTPQGFTAKVTT
ncbi:MAG TPA: glycine oxidase ThiO [Streptosporangiaceae bacterium]